MQRDFVSLQDKCRLSFADLLQIVKIKYIIKQKTKRDTTVKILFIGDVVGENGKRMLRITLPSIKKEYGADICIVNGENSNESGTGMSKRDAEDIFACGADVITGGNHSMRKADISLYEENDYILCPANFNFAGENCGVVRVDMGRASITVINLIGTVFMDGHRNPFFELDRILKSVSDKNIFVDFHGEATSEKQAFANYADGRVSAVVGTHTHVQTNDDRILPGGTAYITDAGCVSAEDSVLGVVKEAAIEKQKYLKPVRFSTKEGGGYVCGIFIETDADGKAVKTEKIKKYAE